MVLNKKNAASAAVGSVAAVFVIALSAYFFFFLSGPSRGGAGATDNNRSLTATSRRDSADPTATQSVQLAPSQLAQFKIEPVEERDFAIRREAVGTIDFNEEMLVPVFPPVQGKIITLFARAGDDVKKGTVLYTIDSPDLVQAGSTLISAAGVLVNTTRVLERAKKLYEAQGIPQKELDQATADQQTAEGALRAARDAVRIFGKTDAEMDRVIAERKVDPVLVVRSPITGRVTARNAAPGQLVQPGTAPAPYTLADISTMWMLANVAESDFASLRLREKVDVTLKPYLGRVFHGTIVNIGATVDPTTHRISVRSEIPDPKHELRPGMFATFTIHTGAAVRSVAVPLNGVVHEGDGTITAWVTTDRKRLIKRTVKIGLEQDGYDQILEGLRPGELVANDGALFLSNELTAASQ